MRGIALPIEMIVIIAVAVLVLGIIGVFFAGSFGKFDIDVKRGQALTQACDNLRAVGCGTSTGDVGARYREVGEDADEFHTLEEICDNLGIEKDEVCKARCGCVGSSGSTDEG